MILSNQEWLAIAVTMHILCTLLFLKCPFLFTVTNATPEPSVPPGMCKESYRA